MNSYEQWKQCGITKLKDQLELRNIILRGSDVPGKSRKNKPSKKKMDEIQKKSFLVRYVGYSQ